MGAGRLGRARGTRAAVQVKEKPPHVDRGVRISDGCVTIWRRKNGHGYRWLCYHGQPRTLGTAPLHMGQVHATWAEALELLRRHERGVHGSREHAAPNPFEQPALNL